MVEAGEGLLVDTAQSEEGVLRGKTVLVSIHKLRPKNITLSSLYAFGTPLILEVYISTPC